MAPDEREADHIAPMFTELGVAPDRLELENRARNTYENARYARKLVAPVAGESRGAALGLNLASGLRWLGLGLHEWLGLVAYRLAGRIDTLLPGPER